MTGSAGPVRRRSLTRWALVAHLSFLLAACAGTPQTDRLLRDAADAPQVSAELGSVPFFPQERYQCGPAALATVLQAAGVDVTPDALVDAVYVPGRHGSFAVEMQAAARRHGRIAYRLPESLEAVVHQIDAGRPVLVFQNLGLSWYQQWHYAVVVGYDLATATLLLRSGRIERYGNRMRVFERTWARAGHWALVLLRPGELPVDANEADYFQAVVDFERSAPVDAAETAYRAGLQRWPDSRWLGIGLSNLRYGRGDRQGARDLLEQLTRVHPDFAVAHNNLAQVLAELGDYAGALAHARTAVNLGGSEAEDFRNTLADIENATPR